MNRFWTTTLVMLLLLLLLLLLQPSLSFEGRRENDVQTVEHMCEMFNRELMFKLLNFRTDCQDDDCLHAVSVIYTFLRQHFQTVWYIQKRHTWDMKGLDWFEAQNQVLGSLGSWAGSVGDVHLLMVNQESLRTLFDGRVQT